MYPTLRVREARQICLTRSVRSTFIKKPLVCSSTGPRGVFPRTVSPLVIVSAEQRGKSPNGVIFPRFCRTSTIGQNCFRPPQTSSPTGGLLPFTMKQRVSKGPKDAEQRPIVAPQKPPWNWRSAASWAWQRQNWFRAVALAVTVFLVYLPAWHGGVLWDDKKHITAPELRSWQGLCRIWYDLKATQQYYPLLHAFWLEAQLWGDDTLGYHLVNILLHVVAAILVAVVLRRLAVPGAYLAAAIFALHPVQVESVAWITELKNTLSAVFYLSAALVYLHFDWSRKKSTYAAALVLFVLGLMSKTVTATLAGGAAGGLLVAARASFLAARRPAAGPLFHPGRRRRPVHRLGRTQPRRRRRRRIRLHFHRALPDRRPSDLVLPGQTLLAGRFDLYLSALARQSSRSVAIRLSPCRAVAAHWTVERAAALARAAGGDVVLRRDSLSSARILQRLSVPLFLRGRSFPVFGEPGHHYLGVGVRGDAVRPLGALGRPAAYCACGLLLFALATRTFVQCCMYTDVEYLYITTIERNPECWMAYNNLGVLYSERGDSEKAIDCYQNAIRINPRDEKAYLNLGIVLKRLGQVDRAIEQYQTVLGVNPDSAEAHMLLGNALMAKKKFPAAVAEYERALAICPEYANAHFNYGNALVAHGNDLLVLGQTDKAIAEYRKALEICPTLANVAVVLSHLEQVKAEEERQKRKGAESKREKGK